MEKNLIDYLPIILIGISILIAIITVFFTILGGVNYIRGVL